MCPQSLPTVLSSFQNLLHLISVWKEGRGRILVAVSTRTCEKASGWYQHQGKDMEKQFKKQFTEH